MNKEEDKRIQSANRRLVGAVIVASFISLGMAEAFIGPALGYFAAKWGASLADSGLTFTMLFAGSCGAAIASSWLLRRLGLARLLAVDTLLLAGGVALFALAPNLPLVLPITLILGLGAGGLAMMLNFAATTIYASRHGVALNLLNACFGIGALSGPLLVRFALAGGMPLEGLLLGFAVVVALLGLTYLVLPLATPAAHTADAIPPHLHLLLRNRYVLTLSLIFFLYVGAEVGFGGWAATIATQGARLDAATAALVATAFWLAFTVGRMLAALIATRLPTNALLIGAAGVGVIGGLLAAVSNGPLLFAGAVLVGLGCAPIFPAAFVLATNYRPAWAANVTGLAMLGASLGGAVLPYLQGQLLTFGVLVGAGFTSAVLLLIIALQLSLPHRDATPVTPSRNTGTQAAVEC